MALVGAVSGGLLAWVYGRAAPLIAENRRRVIREAVLAVIPDAKAVAARRVGKTTIYRATGRGGGISGYAFPAETPGFQGQIRMMVGMDKDFKKITGVRIVENVETPGLGNRITDKGFLGQFIGLRGDRLIVLLKNQPPAKAENEVEAVTGATISSRAVVNGVNEAVARVRRSWRRGGER